MVVVGASPSPDPTEAASRIEVVAEEVARTNVEVAEIRGGVPNTHPTQPIAFVTAIMSMGTKVNTVKHP